MLGAYLQELRELGFRRTLFRIGWECRTRLGLAGLPDHAAPSPSEDVLRLALEGSARSPLFTPPGTIRETMASFLPAPNVKSLEQDALAATRGRIRCFSRWEADFGAPVDWYLNPQTGRRWDASRDSSRALAQGGEIGDVKLTWEPARFPQAYLMARIATFQPALAPSMFEAFASQVESFLNAAPVGKGIHWASSQEVVFRLMAWCFACDVFRGLGCEVSAVLQKVHRTLCLAGGHIEANLDYARHAVYNNHLIAEALGLYLAGRLVPGYESASRWREIGWRTLEEEAGRQFCQDGGYIQNSHNYHRLALQLYLWAWKIGSSERTVKSSAIQKAIESSVDFLWAHQDPVTGSLPNYGANDGALPSLWSTCDFSDFRPTLQAASIATRGLRLYAPGPWDEESVWLFGPETLKLPQKKDERRSVSFPVSGYQVLRGREESTFGSFRCGSILDRFSQIDMLHLDVWWKGANVLVDAGSYLYNGPSEWHQHFYRTASHNTLSVDGRDQMLHLRKFKSVYWTRARLRRFEEASDWVIADGEHYGYQRLDRGLTHRRSILFAKAGVWLVMDTLTGTGRHSARLQWLGGAFPFVDEAAQGRMLLRTPNGGFVVQVYDLEGKTVAATLKSGDTTPPRGWISRYYGEKIPVPSLVVEMNQLLPITLVSVLGPEGTAVVVKDSAWTIRHSLGAVRLRIERGEFDQLSVEHSA